MALLDGVRVVEIASEIAGPYCTKLLADAGADVVKIEAEGGDPAREWVDGALFEYLNTSKRSVTTAADLIEDADVVVVSDLARARELMRIRRPHQVLVTITPFGCTGPWAERPATEFTLQAAAGSLALRGSPSTPPVQVGGRLGDYFAGTAGAIAGLAALIRVQRSGVGAHVDVSTFECVQLTMTLMQSLVAQTDGLPTPPTAPERQIETPSIEPTQDGYVVLTAVTGHQPSDFFAMIGKTDVLDERPELFALPTRMANRDFMSPLIRGFTMGLSTDDVVEIAEAMRIPAGPVGDASTIPTFDHFVERGVFVSNPSGRFVQPRVPYRISDDEPRPFAAVPRRGEHEGAVSWPPAKAATGERESTVRPLEGTRVIDCTNVWAGPVATAVLAGLGADVIKVESPKRPDPTRFMTSRNPADSEDWYEWSLWFQANNYAKRSVTIDLDNAEGRELFLDLVRTADVLVENYTPRVFENFGLTWDVVKAAAPDLVMVRMPAFGLDGPWRNRPGFAQTIEAISGMATMTGFPDDDPILPRGFCDPFAAYNVLVPVLVTLFDRICGGARQRFIESPMIEGALNLTAGQIAEYSVTGVVPRRRGNRGPHAAPQGSYRCLGEDSWVAIAVVGDEQWAQLKKVMDLPLWANDPAFDSDESRTLHHDVIDEGVGAWTRSQLADDVAERCLASGIPAAAVVSPRTMLTNPQLQSRGFFEPVDHSIIGRFELPIVPFRFTGIERWVRHCAPKLGEHNQEVLDDLGVDHERRQRLLDLGVMADRLIS